MGYNTKNYTEQGGEKTVIGGELTIEKSGKLTFDGSEVSQATFQSDSEASSVAGIVSDFNKLLGKLRSAGVVFPEAPLITILIEPLDITVTEGSIEESLGLEASVTGSGDLAYQWYSNTTESDSGGTLIEDATDPVFVLPTDITAGTYYYYCVVSAEEAENVTSRVITVTVEEA
ncbi:MULTISPECIES: hypothetical protein [Bacillaceae]|uniref:hypothetical protein n=1 Tax=Bacillaceae TaxID=186817 RepID=UPI00196590F1|nr:MULTISPECIES: hypothetical protein [Bacillaceae]